MSDNNSIFGSRRRFIEGLAAVGAGSVFGWFASTDSDNSLGDGETGTIGFPTVGAEEIERGFDNLSDWDAHRSEVEDILTSGLGGREALDLMEEQFGTDAREDLVDEVADRASPFHYDYYRELAEKAADTGHNESQRFDDLMYAPMEGAATVDAALATVEDTVEVDLGITDNSNGPGEAGAPKQTGTTRVTLDAGQIGGSDDPEDEQVVYNLEDAVEIRSNENDDINGITLEAGHEPARVTWSVKGDDGLDGEAAATIWAFREDFDELTCVLEREWVPVASQQVSGNPQDEASFTVVPNYDPTKTYRVQIFAQDVVAVEVEQTRHVGGN